MRRIYFDLGNASQIFELRLKLKETKQGTSSVTQYFSDLQDLWQELDLDLDLDLDIYYSDRIGYIPSILPLSLLISLVSPPYNIFSILCTILLPYS